MSNNSDGIIRIKLGGINPGRCLCLLPGDPCDTEMLAWEQRDTAHGDTCYSAMTSAVGVAPDLESQRLNGDARSSATG